LSVEKFRREAEECRRLAAASHNAADRAFWLNLVERWKALEAGTAARPVKDKSRSRLKRQPELSAEA